jgi:hypothetical protein
MTYLIGKRRLHKRNHVKIRSYDLIMAVYKELVNVLVL